LRTIYWKNFYLIFQIFQKHEDFAENENKNTTSHFLKKNYKKSLECGAGCSLGFLHEMTPRKNSLT